MRIIHLPNSHTTVKKQMSGRGGSVLLSKGGPGSASSYYGLDDYLQTTGRGIYPVEMGGNGLSSSLGKGLSPLGGGLFTGKGLDKRELNRKLESLSIAPKKPKVKNIAFNL